MTTMMAPSFEGQRRIRFSERQIPVPGEGQLLLRVHANALCGSERRQYLEGSAIVPGHEAAGEVVAAGSGTSTRIGARGVVFLMEFCGDCRSCRHGFTNQCLAKRADMGFTHDGGYAPYELVHERIFFPVPDELPLTEATLLLDVMGTTGHALRRIALVRQDVQSLLVAGAGPIGLGAVLVAKLVLGDDVPVYVTDVAPYRLDLAESLGGIPLDARTAAEELASGRVAAVDAAIDSTGKAVARQLCMDALSKRGVLACVGHGETLTLDVSRQLIAPERTVLGSEYLRYDELPITLELLLANRTRASRVITHRFPLERIGEAFELFLGGNTGKVVIEQEA